MAASIQPGVQIRLVKETTIGAGVTTKEVALSTDSLLVTLYVSSVTSGSIIVKAYAVAGDDDGEQSGALFTFPTITAPTTDMLLKAGALATQRVRIEVTYTGICSYEIHVRAINGGASVTKILGSESLRFLSTTVGTSVIALIPAALTDRSGIVIKNWSTTQTVYLGATIGEATSSNGYPLAPKDGLSLDVAAGVAIYAVSDAAGADIRIAEAGN
jgi:hypothetical protein